jgi:serine/threonine-protein kinase RsbW
MQASEVVRLELPANARYLNVLGVCIGEMLSRVDGMSDPQQTIYNIQLAVHEGCTNIVDHAYVDDGGRIAVNLMLGWSPPQIIVELHDNGRSFDPTSIPDPNFDEPQVRGYGLYLMRQIMDEVAYDPQPGHNCWRMVKYL